MFIGPAPFRACALPMLAHCNANADVRCLLRLLCIMSWLSVENAAFVLWRLVAPARQHLVAVDLVERCLLIANLVGLAVQRTGV
jgi:hypothetical protein